MILNNTKPIFKITIFTGNILGYDAILIFICIQTKQNSLDAYTKTDAVLD